MEFFIIYLCIGAMIMAFAVFRTKFRNEPDTWSKITAMHGDNVVVDKIIDSFIAPLLGCLFVVIAWPLLLAYKVVDIRKHPRIVARMERQPGNTDPDAARYIFLGRSIKKKEEVDSNV